MKKELSKIMKWSKPQEKIIYFSFLIEAIITIVVAGAATWSKTYGLNKSMFQLQTPIFILGALISFCSVDCMSFFGSLYERQILKALLSTDPWFFLKRYLFISTIFSLIAMVFAGFMNLNKNLDLNWSFYISIILLSIFCVFIFIGILSFSLIIKKQWLSRILIIWVIFQTFTVGISFYPFFVNNINPWINNSIGILFPIFSAANILNNVNQGVHLSILMPIILSISFTLSGCLLLKNNLKFDIKRISLKSLQNNKGGPNGIKN